MLRCKEVTQRASEFIDDELSWRERIGWKMHLLICHRCRHFVQHLRLTISSASKMALRQADHGDVERVMEKVKQEKS